MTIIKPINIIWPKTTSNTLIVNMNVYNDVYANFVLLHVFITARHLVCDCRYFLSYYKINIRHEIDILSLVENIILNDYSTIVFNCSTALLIIGSNNEIRIKHNIGPRNCFFHKSWKYSNIIIGTFTKSVYEGSVFLMYPLTRTD